MNMKQIKITLTRSVIGHPEKHRLVVKGLGLGRTQDSVVRTATPEILGMVNKVNFLVRVEDVK